MVAAIVTAKNHHIQQNNQMKPRTLTKPFLLNHFFYRNNSFLTATASVARVAAAGATETEPVDRWSLIRSIRTVKFINCAERA